MSANDDRSISPASPSGSSPSDSGAGKACDNCHSSCDIDDIFCERCGYDFITGSMPGSGAADGPGSTTVPPPSSATASAAQTPVPSVLDTGPQHLVNGSGRTTIDIAIDSDYFASVVTEGEVSLPTVMSSGQRLELHGGELHIGRTSASRGIHPTIDVEALTGDPAVSSQHAVLRVADDGSMTITDVGSTNGTFVGSYVGDPVTQGVAIDLPAGLPVFVGAWTRLVVVID